MEDNFEKLNQIGEKTEKLNFILRLIIFNNQSIEEFFAESDNCRES